MDSFVSTEEVARFLGISRPTVIKYIQNNRLKAVRTGKAYKITRTDLASFARQMGMDESRVAGLGSPPPRQGKKTARLDSAEASPLTRHQPPLPLLQDAQNGTYYFLLMPSDDTRQETLIQVKHPKFFIGRHSQASLVINDRAISSIHATLLHSENQVQLIDESTNGTLIGGGSIQNGESVVLGDGDQFQIGSMVFTLVAAERADLYLIQGLKARKFHETNG